jgi:hypothetical protein
MTAQTPQQQAAAEPRAAGAITPTPTAHEVNTWLGQQAAGTLPHVWSLAMDGSAIDPKSFDPTAKTTSFP